MAYLVHKQIWALHQRQDGLQIWSSYVLGSNRRRVLGKWVSLMHTSSLQTLGGFIEISHLVHKQVWALHKSQDGLQVWSSDVLGSIHAHTFHPQICQVPDVGCDLPLHLGRGRVQIGQALQIATLHIVPAYAQCQGVCA